MAKEQRPVGRPAPEPHVDRLQDVVDFVLRTHEPNEKDDQDGVLYLVAFLLVAAGLAVALLPQRHRG